MSESEKERPVALITTSREPSPRTRSLVKDLAALSSGMVRATRGKQTFKELLARAFHLGAKTIIIVGEKRGNPSIIRIYDIEPIWVQRPPLHTFTIFLRGVALSREARSGLPSRPVDRIYVIAESFHSETERTLSLALAKMFSATIVSPRSKRNGLDVIFSSRGGLYIVRFKLGGTDVGPVLRVKEARVVGRPIEGD